MNLRRILIKWLIVAIKVEEALVEHMHMPMSTMRKKIYAQKEWHLEVLCLLIAILTMVGRLLFLEEALVPLLKEISQISIAQKI
jgi:hypothetical protein